MTAKIEDYSKKSARHQEIQAATKYAIEVPYRVMELCLASFDLIRAMAETGNPNSVSDARVGALCARAAIHGAYMNVQINASDLEDKAFVEKTLAAGQSIVEQADVFEKEIMQVVNEKIGK